MDHAQTIKSLGGAKAVAEALRARGIMVADVTARSWSLHGRTIPAKYWAHIAAIAEAAHVAVSFEALAAAAAAPADATPAGAEAA